MSKTDPSTLDGSKDGVKSEVKDEAEQMLNQIHKKLADAFEIFDADKTRTVDAKEMPTIIHSLNLVPTQGEMQDIISEVCFIKMEEGDNSDIIKYEKFLSVMTEIMMNRKFRAANENQLYKALQVLDVDKKGYYTKDEIIKLMTTEGEPFNAEEVNDMLQTCLACVDPESNSDEPQILYKYYINELVVNEKD